jgi:hypothetical protein
MSNFFEKIRQLQSDDHRYYHQCRINQTLHLISAVSFLVAYGLVFKHPAEAALVGWLIGMVSRQSGHLFFEPRGFDNFHQATYEYKESIKAGFNMKRKAVLIAVWLSLPVLLWLSPDWGGLIAPTTGFIDFWHEVGLFWLALACAGLLARSVQLCFLRGPAWGLAWACKILLDPFHNIASYWHSPIALLQGQRYDPLDDYVPTSH